MKSAWLSLHALGVDPNEDLGDLLLVGLGAEFDDLEPEVAEVADPVDALLEPILLLVVQARRRGPRRADAGSCGRSTCSRPAPQSS